MRPPDDTAQEPSEDDIRQALERRFAITGEKRYRRALNALSQLEPGRRPINDNHALAEVEAILARGTNQTLHAVLLRVAKATAGAQDPEIVAERYRRKWKAKKDPPNRCVD